MPGLADLDPFSEAFLADPYPHHERLREAGTVVRLDRYGLWAMARHAEVRAALDDWRTWCSGAGVGLADFRKETPWRPPSLLLEADPPAHTGRRAVMMRILSRPAMTALRAGFEREAERLVDDVVARGRIDAVTDLAQAFPLRVFPDAVGIGREGREHLLPYGNLAFNAFGPRNALLEEALAQAGPAGDWIASQCRREALAPDGFGAQIYGAADAGEIPPGEAGMLVRSLLTAGVDTTVHGLGNALYCFAGHPGQWRRLHEAPALASAAFDEVLRHESPVQTFFRTSTRELAIDGTRIGAGEKVLLFLGAANRDPRAFTAPDDFDIGRRSAGHVAFGSGIHMCVGQMLAKLEAEVLLTALARRVRTIEPAGEPVRKLNNTLRGLASLPVYLQPR